jgi:hypothetical protein
MSARPRGLMDDWASRPETHELRGTISQVLENCVGQFSNRFSEVLVGPICSMHPAALGSDGR